jgi:TonB family protein
MKKEIIIYTIIICLTAPFICRSQEVAIEQIESIGTRHSIFYTLYNDGKKTDIFLYASNDGGITWKGPLEDAVRDVGTGVEEGSIKTIIWYSDSSFLNSGTRFKLDGKTSANPGYDITGDKIPDVEYTFVEQEPIPPTGDFFNYTQLKIQYPILAKAKGIVGTVFVTFQVNAEGRVRNPKVLKGIGYACDEEAIRVVSEMPKWKPGINAGRAVLVRMNMPVVFKLK